MATADLNRDGYLDIVTAADNSSKVQVLFNNGSGAFGSPFSNSTSTVQV